MLKKLLMLPLAAILCLFTASAASAQATQAGITPCGTPVTLSVTTSSSNAQLSTCNGTVVVWNVGSNEAFFTTGTTSGTVATTSNYSLPAGTSIVLNFGTSGRYLAAITASSTTTIRAWSGIGMTALAGGSGSGGGGGSVTQGTVPWVDSVHYWGSSDTALGAPSNFGTSPGAVMVPGVNAAVISSALPTGASTSANQATEIASLANILAAVQGDVPSVTGPLSAAAAAATKSLMTGGQYLSSLPTMTNTQQGAFLLDASSRQLVASTPSPAPAGEKSLTGNSCGSAVSSCVLKASAGNFFGAYAECTSACWLMVFNATSAPSNGSTTAGIGSGNLVECLDISANGSKSITYPTFPRAFSVGITAVISSTACGTLTLSTVGFISGTVM